MNAKTIVAYYRVSTRQQARSGLGLLAQQDAVRRYVAANRCKVLAELTEVESGRDSGRPKLAEALWFCRVYDAKLVIARLDRLARSTVMIAGLMKSGVDFVAADMPLANRFTIHILAAVAEYEARLISERTMAAFAAAKARGRKFGNPDPSTHRFSDAARKLQVRAIREKSEDPRARLSPIALRAERSRQGDPRDSASAYSNGYRDTAQTNDLARPNEYGDLRLRWRTKTETVGVPPYERSQAFKAFGPPDLVAEPGLRLIPTVASVYDRGEPSRAFRWM